MSGYTKLAGFMTGKHHTILKKYQHLAIRDLLYLQAELCHLEHEYRLIAEADASKDDERQFYDREWIYLKSSEDRGFGGEQWAIAMAIRAKLREYYSAILQYTQVSSLAEPKELERDALHTWIRSHASGGGCGFLGRDLGGFKQPSAYENNDEKDLVMLTAKHGEDDLFTRFLLGPALTIFHCFWRITKAPLPLDPESAPVEDNRGAMHYYSERHVHEAINIMGTVLSSLTPMVSIVVLSFVRSAAAQLGLVCAFTLLFSLILAIATRARRIEIFAATAGGWGATGILLVEMQGSSDVEAEHAWQL